MIKNVLFDLDGTIIDSSRCIFKVYAELFKELNLTLPPEAEMRKFIGPPIETTISQYLDDGIAEACVRFREIYKTVDLMATNTLYDGIKEELEKVKASGKKLYLATTKSEYFATAILKCKGLYDLFDGVYGVRPDLGRYEKNQVIDAIIEERKLKKSECILIGDTAFDVEGAEKCGVNVAIVRYGFGNAEDFLGKQIAFFADTVHDIADGIERL